MDDRIDAVKALLLEKIEFHQAALEKLRLKLKQVEEVENTLGQLADGISIEGISLMDRDPKQPYTEMGLTEAVKDALKQTALPKTLRQIRKLLLRGGFKQPPAHFSEKVNATLHRLTQQGLVEVAKDKQERNTFQLKNLGTGVEAGQAHRSNARH